MRLNITQYIDQSPTILSMMWPGLTTLPASAQRFHYDNVEFRHISGIHAQAEMSMVWRPDQHRPAVTTFRLLAAEHFTGKRCAVTPP